MLANLHALPHPRRGVKPIARRHALKILLGGVVLLGLACSAPENDSGRAESLTPTSPPTVSTTHPSVASTTTATTTTISQAARSPDGEVVRYANDDDLDHRMIVFLPPGTGPFPAMVLIHGGGWRGGVPEDMTAIARVYVQQGIAAFSVAYQLSTPAQPSWPVNVQDVVCATRHIRANAAKYDIDPDRIGAHGVSAGAHLAGMLGTIDGDAPFLDGACGDPEAGHAVMFVASYSGPLDLELMGEVGEGAVFQVSQFLGATFGERPQLWRDASPHSHLDARDPPFLIAHGDADRIVPVGIATSFAEQLEAAGGEPHLVIMEGVDHGEPLPDANEVRLMLIARLLRP